MNASLITRSSLIALALGASATAFADQATWDVDQALARQVAAAQTASTTPALARTLPQQVRTTAAPLNDGNYPPAEAFAAGKSREQVRSETLAAIASGELRAAVREGFEGHFAPSPRRDDTVRVAGRGAAAR